MQNLLQDGQLKRDLQDFKMSKININTLVLHKIVKDEALNFEDITVDVFEEILTCHKQNKMFSTIENAFSGNIENDCICLTFDDGFKSDIEIVLPRLKEKNAYATFFIVKSYLNKNGYMNEKDVIELSNQGMQIGSHSMSHPNFLEIDNSKKINELESSRKYLEDLTSKKISTFSFPFGFTNKTLINLVFDAGYEYCCTSQHGVSKNYSRIIPRNSINGSHSIKKVFQIIDPNFMTKSAWFLEDIIKSNLKSISPKFYKKLRNIISKQ